MSCPAIITLELRLPDAPGIHSIRAVLTADENGETVEYYFQQCSLGPSLRIPANGIEPLRLALEATRHLVPKAYSYLTDRRCRCCAGQMDLMYESGVGLCSACRDEHGFVKITEEL